MSLIRISEAEKKKEQNESTFKYNSLEFSSTDDK